MSTIFTPSSIPSGATVAGSPFSPGGIPGQAAGVGGSPGGVPGVISSSSPIVAAGFGAGMSGNYTPTNWPTANLAIAMPFSIPYAVTIRSAFWQNGGTLSGNVDCGVYNEDGTKVITTGSVVQAGATTTQNASLSATTLAAGSYYLVLCLDNVTGTFYRLAPGGTQYLQGAGCQQATAAVPMGASLTFANVANNLFPHCGVAISSVL